jgi:hypothetical protein
MSDGHNTKRGDIAAVMRVFAMLQQIDSVRRKSHFDLQE